MGGGKLGVSVQVPPARSDSCASQFRGLFRTTPILHVGGTTVTAMLTGGVFAGLLGAIVGAAAGLALGLFVELRERE